MRIDAREIAEASQHPVRLEKILRRIDDVFEVWRRSSHFPNSIRPSDDLKRLSVVRQVGRWDRDERVRKLREELHFGGQRLQTQFNPKRLAPYLPTIGNFVDDAGTEE